MIGDLVECKWMYGLCIILKIHQNKHGETLYRVYHFDTSEDYLFEKVDIEFFYNADLTNTS